MTIVPMEPGHWERVRAIYLEGIDSGNATFETDVPSHEVWNRSHAEECRYVALAGDRVVGWAALTPVSGRRVYRGVADVSVYVAADARGAGVGRLLLEALVRGSEAAGYWTLQAGIFPENDASIRAHTRAGFRLVGRRERIGEMNGIWRDVLLLERRSPTVGR